MSATDRVFLAPIALAGLLTLALRLRTLWTNRDQRDLESRLDRIQTGAFLIPVLGFLNVYPFIYSFVADHFQYLASIGVILLVAAAVAIVLARLPLAARRIGGIVTVGLVGALAGLTWNQCRMDADSVALYKATL